MMDKLEEISVFNYVLKNSSSILFSTKEEEKAKLYEYPSKKSIVELSNISGGLNYFMFNDYLCVNDLGGNIFYLIRGNEQKKGVGFLSRLDDKNLILKSLDKTILLDSKFQEVRPLHNYPQCYQDCRYGENLYCLSDGVKRGEQTKYRSRIFKYSTPKDLIISFFDALPYSWHDENDNIQDGTICQIIGHYENELVLHIAKYQIIGIDIATKEVKWEVSDFIKQDEQKRFLAFGESFTSRTPMKWHHAKNSDRFYLLVRHFLWEFNLQTKEVDLIKDYTDSPAIERWNFIKTKLFGTKILFAGTKGFSATPNKIGIFDIELKKVIWEYSIANGYFKEAPELLQDNYLIALDSNNTMHIFKSRNQLA